MTSQIAVSVEQLSKHFGDLQALDQVSFEIKQGEFFGLLGPNGAGKSTLISAMAGLLKPSSGNISILGADVQKDYRQSRKHLGVVPQELVMDPFFTVRETLSFQSGYFGIRNNTLWIDELLQQLGLSDKADTNMRKLSGGMKRRVLIAQALVHRPQVLVLDEPTAGVDVELRKTLWGFVRRLHADGHTIVLTTHYLEEAEELCDRIAIIDHGKMIALESKDDLLALGLGNRLLVTAQKPINNVPAEFTDKVARIEGKELELMLNRETDSMMDILDRLRDASIEIETVTVLSERLEEVFVRLTSKAVSETDSGDSS